LHFLFICFEIAVQSIVCMLLCLPLLCTVLGLDRWSESARAPLAYSTIEYHSALIKNNSIMLSKYAKLSHLCQLLFSTYLRTVSTHLPTNLPPLESNCLLSNNRGRASQLHDTKLSFMATTDREV
jgi:hypothetical protein